MRPHIPDIDPELLEKIAGFVVEYIRAYPEEAVLCIVREIIYQDDSPFSDKNLVKIADTLLEDPDDPVKAMEFLRDIIQIRETLVNDVAKIAIQRLEELDVSPEPEHKKCFRKDILKEALRYLPVIVSLMIKHAEKFGKWIWEKIKDTDFDLFG